VKWVNEESLHLTLRFLGETPDEDLPKVKAALSAACTGLKPLALSINGTGVFPNVNRPRVFWVGLKGDATLFTLQQNIEDAMVALDYPIEENKFTPHLTVARIKEPIGKQRITDALLSYKISSEPATISEVLIMRSQMNPEGSRYDVVGRVKLNGER
jgi:2'-5' RNA ligase